MASPDLKSQLAAKAGATKETAVTTTVADSFQSFLEKRKGEIAKAIPSHVTIDRILRIAVAAVAQNPKLAACTQQSLIAGVIISSQLGLELNTPLGQAWLIPYDRSVKQGNTWVKIPEAQFQLGYQGIIDLAYRTKLYRMIYAESVYSKDQFSYAYGLNKDLFHVPCEDEDRGELIGVYAVYHLKEGGFDFKYWSVGKINSHAQKYSKSWDAKEGKFQNKSAWADSFEGMAKTPVLKDLLKLAPKSIELAKQLSLDETTKGEIVPDMSTATEIDFKPINVGQIPETAGETPITAAEVQEQTKEFEALLQETFGLLAELAKERGETPDDMIDALTKGRLGCQQDLMDKAPAYIEDIKLLIETEIAKEAE